LERFATVAIESFAARPGHRADFPVSIHDSQRVPAPFQNVENALRIHRDRARVHQRRLRRFRAVSRDAFIAVPGHGRYDSSLKVHRPNPAVVEISQVEVFATGIESDAIDIAKLGGACRTAIAAETFPARAGERENFSALCLNPPHAVIPGIGNKEIIGWTDCEAVHAVELRLGGGPAIASVTFLTCASENRQHSPAIHSQHPFTAGHLNNEHISAVVEVDTEGSVQAATRGWSGHVVPASGNHNDLFGPEEWSEQRENQRDERKLPRRTDRHYGKR